MLGATNINAWLGAGFSLALSAASVAHAQPPSPPTADPADITNPADSAPPQSPAAYAQALIAAYATGPFAERITLTLERAGERRSLGTITLARDDAPQPTLVLLLGPLRFLFQPGELTAVHRANDATYWRTRGDGWGVITTNIPEVPLPQLVWIMQLPHALPWGARTDFIARTHWESAEPVGNGRPGETSQMMLSGRADGRPVRATIRLDSDSRWRLVEWRMPATSEVDWSLRIAASPLTPEESAPLAALDLAARSPVEHLSQLRAPLVALAPGSPLPELALFTANMQAWGLADAFLSAADGPLNAPLPTHTDTFALLVLARNTPECLAAAEDLHQAFASVRDRLDRARRQGRTTLPRFFVRRALVLDPADCLNHAGGRMRGVAPPLPTTDPWAVPLLACGGSALLDIFAPKAQLVVVGVDSGRIVRYNAAPDPGAPRADALAREWARLILGPADAALIENEPGQ